MINWFATLGLSIALPLGGVALLVFCVLRGCWAGVGLLLMFTVVYAGASYWPLLTARLPEKPANAVRIVFLNALIQGPDRALQSQAILSRKPDIIALVEADPEWKNRMSGEAFDEYPYYVLHKVGLREGRIVYDDHIALASRWPLEPVGNKGTEGDELALYKVMAPQPFHIFVIHSMAPVFADAVPLRNQFLHDLAEMTLPANTLLVGDFNAVPWDPAMWPLWLKTRMKPYFSWLPTYRRDIPAVPIDHVMTAPDIEMKAIRRWSDGQSDHFGLVVDFEVKKASE